MIVPANNSAMAEKPLARLYRDYIRSNFAIALRLRGLRIKFRPLSYDPFILREVLLSRVYGDVPSGWCVVDIGAHIGIFSLYAALSNARKVVAFEPESRNYRLLAENIQINKLSGIVQAFNSAVWCKDTEKVLFTSRGTAWHTFFPEKYHAGGTQKVDCVGTNSILQPLRRPILLKVDAEGSEYEIIRDISDENLRKIGKIALECHFTNPVARMSFPNVLAWLRLKGFKAVFNKRTRILSAVGNVNS